MRQRIYDVYGIDPNSYMVTWVYDNKLTGIFGNQQTIKELKENQKGVILLYEIPKKLEPELPPLNQIKKDDSNYGIDADWTKVCIHIFK